MNLSGRERLLMIVGTGIGAFSLLLLIISVGIPTWTIDKDSNSVGLFRQCYSSSGAVYAPDRTEGCVNANRVTQGGLSVFGLLLLSFALMVAVFGIFRQNWIALLVALGLFYFSSMFVMSAYATWGVYSRAPSTYGFPVPNLDDSIRYQEMGAGYNLCVAAHYFLWTAMTIFAVGVGVRLGSSGSDSN